MTVGAFIVDLDAATVVTEDSGDDAHTVTIPFRALNRATGARLPFGDLDAYDEILLEAGGAFFYGSADAALVPGGREGEGSLHWWVDGVPASDIVNARLIFGGGAVNEAVVDFADPDADEPLADIPIDATLVIEHYRHTTLEFEEVRVQYNSRSANRPLRSGTAELVMKGIIRADADMPFAGESWQRSNVFLLRPDGTSVSPGRLLTNLHPGDRERVTLVFELERPVAGTYTFGVTASDHEPEAHELSLP